MTLELKKILSTIINYGQSVEPFNYHFKKNSSFDSYLDEFHKFLSIYDHFYFNHDRLLFCLNDYEIKLSSKDLNQMIKLYLYSKNKNNNDYIIIGEFLFSYYNTLTNKEYVKKCNDAKGTKKIFNLIISKYNLQHDFYKAFMNDSFQFYNLILDYCISNQNILSGEIIERACVNFRNNKEKKQLIIKKLLKHQIHPMKLIEYDAEISKNLKYYEKYLINMLAERTYYNYPENIIYMLHSKRILKRKILNMFINDLIDKVNNIQDRALITEESFIQLISEIDQIIKLLNRMLNQLIYATKKQKGKIYECLNNILYIKRFIVSDSEKIESQMQKFEYEQKIPNEKIVEYVKLINENVGILYTHSAGNFTKKLYESLNSYSEHAISYVFNSFTIDSESQVYYKTGENVENSSFKEYYDEKGKEYTETHHGLQNILDKDYYNQLLKYLKRSFLTEQHFIISFFDIVEGKESLIQKLISKGSYNTKNRYIILAKNVLQIEHSVIEIMKKKGINYTKSGFNNLNSLARDYFDNEIYFNGLMYINYILYEKDGLNIRNNISHGNYFKKQINIELLTTFCAMTFINTLERKECEECD